MVMPEELIRPLLIEVQSGFQFTVRLSHYYTYKITTLRCDICTFLHNQEPSAGGFGVPGMLESIYRGRTIYFFSSSCFLKLLSEGEDGWRVPERDVEACLGKRAA